MARLDELIAEAELGEEARNFLNSDLGKCLIGMAQQEVMAAQQALLGANPEDRQKITELQNKARLGLFFEQWLVELISKGEEALNVYKHER